MMNDLSECFWFAFIPVYVSECFCQQLHACPAGLVCLLYLSLLLFTPQGNMVRLHLNTEITAMPDSDKHREQQPSHCSHPPPHHLHLHITTQRHMDMGEEG